MHRTFGTTRGWALAIGLASAAMVRAGAAHAAILQVLYNFTGGKDGASPEGGVIGDGAGNLYGATSAGGRYGLGTVFKLTPAGKLTVLHTFKGGKDGSSPWGDLIADGAGNLYGATSDGGKTNRGTVYSVSPTGKEKVLYQFRSGSDGWNPMSGLLDDANGNLFGTTVGGGSRGEGMVFKLSASGKEVEVFGFVQDAGDAPLGTLVQDGAGNLYGTTFLGGGVCITECGVAFKIDPTGKETVLHAFAGGPDGSTPMAGVILDTAGNVYGATAAGGTGPCSGGCGTLFTIASDGTETVLYSFDGTHGSAPMGALIRDDKGQLHGTTEYGGSEGSGTVFEVSKNGTEKVLYNLSQGIGKNPRAGLWRDANGIFYGTTTLGGNFNHGVVFKLSN